MPFRYFIKQLLLPPGILLLLLLLAWGLRRSRPRLAGWCFALGLGGFWLMSLPVMVEWGARSLERLPPLPQSQWASLAEQADVIVVLGSGRERGDPAVGLRPAHRRGPGARTLCRAPGQGLRAAGADQWRPALRYAAHRAALMAQSLLDDFGVTVRWQEGRSRTTWENAQFSAEVLLPLGIKRVVVVTQAWHMPRSVWSFEHAGFEVVPAPVGFLGVDNARPLGGWMPEFKSIWQSGQLLNEAVGQLGYRLFYR